MKRLITALTLTAILTATATHVEAAPTPTTETAPTFNPSQHCSKRLLTGRRGGIATCNNLPPYPDNDWRLNVTCYANSSLQGFPTIYHSPTIYGNRSNVTVYCGSSKPYAYSVSVLSINSTGLRTPTLHAYQTTRPQHADGCRSWTTSGYAAAAYCTHLDKGWWMYLQIVCKQKYTTATYVAYTTRTYSPWTTKQKSCASGYFLASHRTITGNY